MTKKQIHKGIKLIALDMDGTLLDENGEIPIENRLAINEAHEHGIHVVLSTGRSIATCKEHAESLLLSSYLVTVNGSEIWDWKGNLIERNLVELEHIEWLWELTQMHKVKTWATSSERVWFDQMPEDLSSSHWLKFGFHIEEDSMREQIIQELISRNCFEVTNSSPVNIEVNSLGINKAKGLQKVCELLHITMDEVMAVGDSLNDISMLKQAGIGVAMGNAQEVVKDIADYVTTSNQNNGVALAIRKWALKKESMFLN